MYLLKQKLSAARKLPDSGIAKSSTGIQSKLLDKPMRTATSEVLSLSNVAISLVTVLCSKISFERSRLNFLTFSSIPSLSHSASDEQTLELFSTNQAISRSRFGSKTKSVENWHCNLLPSPELKQIEITSSSFGLVIVIFNSRLLPKLMPFSFSMNL